MDAGKAIALLSGQPEDTTILDYAICPSLASGTCCSTVTLLERGDCRLHSMACDRNGNDNGIGQLMPRQKEWSSAIKQRAEQQPRGRTRQDRTYRKRSHEAKTANREGQGKLGG
mgnify:CR=1 FL=1